MLTTYMDSIPNMDHIWTQGQRKDLNFTPGMEISFKVDKNSLMLTKYHMESGPNCTLWGHRGFQKSTQFCLEWSNSHENWSLDPHN